MGARSLYSVAASLSGSALVSINKVTLRLVPGWVSGDRLRVG